MSGPYPPGRASTLLFGHLLIQHTGCGCGFRRSVLPSSVGACAWSVACLAPVAVAAGRPRSMTCSARPALLPQLSSVFVSPRSIQRVRFFSSSFFFVFFPIAHVRGDRHCQRTGPACGAPTHSTPPMRFSAPPYRTTPRRGPHSFTSSSWLRSY